MSPPRFLPLLVLLTGCLNATTESPDEDGKPASPPAAGAPEGAEQEATTDSASSPLGTALFAVRAGTATPDIIYGVWVAKTANPVEGGTAELRLRFSKDSYEMAVRCTHRDTGKTMIVGVKASARVSNDEVSVLEEAVDERTLDGMTCRIRLGPTTTKACTGDPFFYSNCQVVDGLTLKQYGMSSLEVGEVTKVSD